MLYSVCGVLYNNRYIRGGTQKLCDIMYSPPPCQPTFNELDFYPALLFSLLLRSYETVFL